MDDIDISPISFSPHIGQELFIRHYLACMPLQVYQKSELSWAGPDWSTINEDVMSFGSNRQMTIVVLENRRRFTCRPAAPQ